MNLLLPFRFPAFVSDGVGKSSEFVVLSGFWFAHSLPKNYINGRSMKELCNFV